MFKCNNIFYSFKAFDNSLNFAIMIIIIRLFTEKLQKNVRDLLAKHVPEQNTEEAGDEITNSVDEAVQHIDPEVSQLVNLNKHAANAEDVALATKEQLRKIGIDVPSTSQLAW